MVNRIRWRTEIARRALFGGVIFLAGYCVLAQSPALVPPAGAPATRSAPSRASTVIVVRHAEKDSQGEPKDPGLSDRGRARAAALEHLLARTGATHLFTSEYQRARQTLEPLATKLGVTPTVVSAAKPAELIAALAALPEGSTSVVVGHSNTVPDIVARLGGQVSNLVEGPGGKMLDDGAYGRLFVLTIPPAAERSNVAVASIEFAYGD